MKAKLYRKPMLEAAQQGKIHGGQSQQDLMMEVGLIRYTMEMASLNRVTMAEEANPSRDIIMKARVNTDP